MYFFYKIKINRFWIIFLVIFVYVSITFFADITKITYNFQKVNYEYLILILFIETIAITVKSIRQKEFLKNIGVKISFKENFLIYLAGLSFVATPGGAGTLIKAEFLKRKYGFDRSKTVPVIILERFHDILAVTSVIIFILLFLFNWPSMIVVIISVGLISAVYLILRNKSLLKKLLSRISKIKYFEKYTPKSVFNDSIDALIRPKVIVKGWAISLLAWFIEGLGVYVSFLAFKQDVDFFSVIQFYFTSLNYGAISLIPGGVGVTESSFLGLLLLEGLDLSLSTAIVLFVRITTIWFATILGFLAYRYAFKNS